MKQTAWQAKNLAKAIELGWARNDRYHQRTSSGEDGYISLGESLSRHLAKSTYPFLSFMYSNEEGRTRGNDSITKLQYQCGMAYFAGIQEVSAVLSDGICQIQHWERPSYYVKRSTPAPKIPEKYKGLTGTQLRKVCLDDLFLRIQYSFNPLINGNNRAAWVFTSINAYAVGEIVAALKRWSFNPITDWRYNENSGVPIRMYGLCCTTEEHIEDVKKWKRHVDGRPRM